MFVRPKDDTTTALSHDGEEFTADDEGRFDVPEQLGEWLIRVHGFEITDAPAEPSDDKPKRKPAARK